MASRRETATTSPHLTSAFAPEVLTLLRQTLHLSVRSRVGANGRTEFAKRLDLFIQRSVLVFCSFPHLNWSGDDDYLTNETRRKPTTGARCPTLSISGTGSFIGPVTQTRLDI